MQIFLKNYLDDGYRTTTLEVEPTDTVVSLMEKLEERTGGIPPILQRMSVLTANKVEELRHDSGGTLADHGIDGSSLQQVMYTHSGWHELKRKTLAARGIDVDVAAPDGDDMLPPRWVERMGSDAMAMLPPHWVVRKGPRAKPPPPPNDDDDDGKMRIVVEDFISSCCSGQRLVLRVEAGDTVASVMEQVQRRRLGYPPDLQEFRYESKFMCRDSVGTLADYNVKNGSEISLELSLGAAIAADVEERKLKKAKDLAAAVERQKRDNAEEIAVGSEEDNQKLKKAKVDQNEGTLEGVPPVQPQQQLNEDKTPAQE